MVVPLRSAAETESHAVFQALMWAQSYPGEAQKTPLATLEAVGRVLLDLETSFYTPDAALAQTLRRTGAKVKAVQDAEYLFFPKLTDAELPELRGARRGDLLYPDRAATLVLGCHFGVGTRLTLEGPGVETKNAVEVGGLPPALWTLRSEVRAYPLGWDVFLCDGAQLVGIPRSAEVGVEGGQPWPM